MLEDERRGLPGGAGQVVAAGRQRVWRETATVLGGGRGGLLSLWVLAFGE